MEFFAWLENSAFSAWVREAETVFAYDFFLASHAIGMAAVVGLSAGFALRVLGFAADVPLRPMEKFFPFMYAGFWVNALSGVVLFAAYPTRAVTNPGFFVKLGCIVLAVITLRRLRHEVFGHPATLDAREQPKRAKVTAGGLLLFWWGAILAGRLLAYHDIANVERGAVIAVTAVTAVLIFGIYLGNRKRTVVLREPEPGPAKHVGV